MSSKNLFGLWKACVRVNYWNEVIRDKKMFDTIKHHKSSYQAMNITLHFAHMLTSALILRSPNWYQLSGLTLKISWTNFLLREKTNWASGFSTSTTSPPGLFRNWSVCLWEGGRRRHPHHLSLPTMTLRLRNTLWTFLRRPRTRRRWGSRRFSRSWSLSWTWPGGSTLRRTLHWVPGCEHWGILTHLSERFW